ncbi:MAG: molybdenum cofactor biosynthesis protein MoaE [Polyangiaceae bacterium]|nr:molybdenum cofactor biosynthesis protein MoaE [Polyangiaceae bacterium]
MSLTAIRTEPLDLAELVVAVSHPGAGGIATFLGVVRDHNEGRPVSRLEYHAYVAMAESELRLLAAEVEREIEGVRVAVTHRIGELGVGDAAVACAASAPHRGEAFRACRELIDRVKARLPIWKREHGPDGPYWVGWQDARCTPGDEPAHEHGHAHTHEHGGQGGHSHG